MKISFCFFVGMWVAFVSMVNAGDNLLPDTAISTEKGWSIYVHDPARESGASGQLLGGNAAVKTAESAQEAVAIQLIKPIDLDDEQTYTLKFDVESDKSGKIFVIYCLNIQPFNYYSRCEVDIEPGSESYECQLIFDAGTRRAIDEPGSLRFALGMIEDAEIVISNVSLEQN